MLEEDDTLATEAASEEDQNGTGLEALAELSGTQSLANLYAQIHVSNSVGERVVISQFPESTAWLTRSDECNDCCEGGHKSQSQIHQLPSVMLVELNVTHRAYSTQYKRPGINCRIHLSE